MEKYQENNASKDMFYEEQKREKIKEAQEEVAKAKAEATKNAPILEDKDASEEYPIDVAEGREEDGREEEDPTAEEEDEPEVVKKGSEVSDEIKDSLETDDPWMSRKNAAS